MSPEALLTALRSAAASGDAEAAWMAPLVAQAVKQLN